MNYDLEKLYSERLTVKESLYGHKHIDVALILDKLGLLYQKNGNFTKAESSYIESINIKTDLLGKSNLETAKTSNYLALLYQVEGRLNESESSINDVLDIRKKTLGYQHKETLKAFNSLASINFLQQKYSEAEKLYNSVLQYTINTSEHEEIVLITKSNLAILYQTTKEYFKANQLFNEVAETSIEVFGKYNKNTARALYNLGYFNLIIGNEEDSFKHYQEALKIYQKIDNRSLDHIKLLEKMGVSFYEANKYKYAEDIYHKILTMKNECTKPLDLIMDIFKKLSGLLEYSCNKLKERLSDYTLTISPIKARLSFIDSVRSISEDYIYNEYNNENFIIEIQIPSNMNIYLKGANDTKILGHSYVKDGISFIKFNNPPVGEYIFWVEINSLKD